MNAGEIKTKGKCFLETQANQIGTKLDMSENN